MSDIEELAKAEGVDAMCRLGLDQIPVLEHTAQTTVDCKLACVLHLRVRNYLSMSAANNTTTPIPKKSWDIL